MSKSQGIFMNCPWCQKELQEDFSDNSDDIYICNCLPNEEVSCQAFIDENDIAVNYIIWVSHNDDKLCLIKTKTLWCIYGAPVLQSKLAQGNAEDLTLEQGAQILTKFKNLLIFS